MVRVAWLFMLSKVIELMDTVSVTATTTWEWEGWTGGQACNLPILPPGDIYPPEEGRASDLPPCLPPLGASLELVVGDKNCSR